MGCVIFYSQSSVTDNSAAEMASLVAQGTYSSLYLISTFSAVLALSETLSDICGLSIRVTKLLQVFDCIVDESELDCYRNSIQLLRRLFGKATSRPASSSLKTILISGTSYAYCGGLSDETDAASSLFCSENTILLPSTQEVYRSKCILDAQMISQNFINDHASFDSFKIFTGDRLLIFGPTGCGKR